MIKCSVCKENMALIFVTKYINGKQVQEGLCLKCAKKQGLKPVDQLLEQSGVTEEELDDLNNQVGNIFNTMDMEGFGNLEDEDDNMSKGMYMKFFNGFSTNNDSMTDDDINSNVRVKTRNGAKKKYLDAYGTNLTKKAKENKLDLVVGREKELERVIQILNRRNKNNPVLIGEPGVGKTAIAEALAQRIVQRNVPIKLFNAEVYMLDFTSIVAGTQFRGQFEGRMKGILEEAISLGNVILVIDELHNIMSAGEADSAMNAANILKPALSRGEIQIIGATTLEEYRKYIEKDKALERRFQPVLVEEPTAEETIEILNGIREYYENYHKVKISDEVIRGAVDLSQRYITDRFLPDKAIDVIDEASSRANLSNLNLANLEKVKEDLRIIQEEKDSAVMADSIEDYQKAADLKIRECKLEQELKEYENQNIPVEVTYNDIAKVIEMWTKIPVQKISEVETQKLLMLEERLHKSIVGQDKAVSVLSSAIRRNRTDFRSKKKPVSFIFVGPTGVGKTELVKAVTRELFGDEKFLIRLDMSEYMEKHTASKLIGAPPGYVGYDEAGQLTQKIRRNPYSVILLDEIEKAHQDVYNILLQILDDGILTDSHGVKVDFSNTIIIMTSNAGTNSKGNGIGFFQDSYDMLENKVQGELKQIFKPEFLNRVDDVVIFKELSREELKEIIGMMLSEVKAEIENKKMTVSIEKGVHDIILEQGYDTKYGARPLRKTIQKLIENPLSDNYLKGVYKEGSNIKIHVKNGKIVID
ncbi:MAG: ATP-dependent Clp protease ATP-binding subunit [Clostridiales bacterium]|nr:ATP-dependent Clp protease ATP-binding subunit [Clostridiales bacterium]